MVSEQIIFVIQTGSYAGNFERDICAFVTGQMGDCGVGDDMASEFLEDVGEDTAKEFDEIIGSKSDEDGCARPCAMMEPPEFHSVAIYFDDMPTQQQIDLMKDRAVEYALTKYNRKSYHNDRAPLIIKGFELVREITETKLIRKVV